MSDKVEDKVEEEPAEAQGTEYEKPAPAVAPRNVVLAEIAASVAEQHKKEFSETAPTVDDEGQVTQPVEAAPSEETPAAEEPPSQTPPSSSAVEPSPAAGQPASIVATEQYEVVIEGQKVKVPGQTLIDAGIRTLQKEAAADYRLKMASQLLQEAEARLKAAPARTEEPAPKPAAEKTDAELAYAIQFGTPEQAAEALSLLRGKPSASPEQLQQLTAMQARRAAADELQFQDALKVVQSEYGDLLDRPTIKRLFFSEEDRLRRAGDKRPYAELYKAIGDSIRQELNLPKPAAASTPAGAIAKRVELKKQTPPVPRTAATRLQEAAASAKVKTPSEIIASMAEQRGKTRLTQPRKGA